MKFIKFVYIIVFFLVSGELVFRFDESVRGNNEIKEEISLNDSLYANELCQHNIYLLGDSYTAGQGIPKGMKISDLIKFKDYCLVDLTKGGDDWIDYYNKYNKIIENSKKGDIIIIGINWNDILYSENDFINKNSRNLQNISSKSNGDNSKINQKNWYRILYSNSKLANTLSSNIQNTLKRHGLALPIGDFHYLSKKGYIEKKHEIDEILFRIDSLNSAHDIMCILYIMPEYNLLANKKYFSNYISYYNQKNLKSIDILNGFDDFNNAKEKNYTLSIHDGHPNSQAHKIIAKSILKYLSYSISNQKNQSSN
jgi:hypothetical protein